VCVCLGGACCGVAGAGAGAETYIRVVIEGLDGTPDSKALVLAATEPQADVFQLQAPPPAAAAAAAAGEKMLLACGSSRKRRSSSMN